MEMKRATKRQSVSAYDSDSGDKRRRRSADKYEEEEETPNATGAGADSNFQCKECQRSFTEAKNLKLHCIHSHLKNKNVPLKCKNCNFVSTNEGNFRRHATRCALEGATCNTCSKIQCPLCPITNVLKRHIEVHVYKMHHKKFNPCKTCGLQLPDRHSHGLHVASHKGKAYHSCTLCSYASVRQSEVDAHMAIHDKEKPFNCISCTIKYSKRVHKQVNTSKSKMNETVGLQHQQHSNTSMETSHKREKTAKDCDNEIVIESESEEAVVDTERSKESEACILIEDDAEDLEDIEAYRDINSPFIIEEDDIEESATAGTEKSINKAKVDERNVIQMPKKNENEVLILSDSEEDESDEAVSKKNVIIIKNGDEKHNEVIVDIPDDPSTHFQNNVERTDKNIYNHSTDQSQPFQCSQCPFNTPFVLDLKSHLEAHIYGIEPPRDSSTKKHDNVGIVSEVIIDSESDSEYEGEALKELKLLLKNEDSSQSYPIILEESNQSNPTIYEESNQSNPTIYEESNQSNPTIYEEPLPTNSWISQKVFPASQSPKVYKCTYCNAVFKCSSNMIRHTRYKHTKERPYQCPECDYAGVEFSKLQNHLLTHKREREGRKSYSCDHCDCTFSTPSNLVRHKRDKHTAEMRYQCTVCHQRYVDLGQLLKHMNVHKGINGNALSEDTDETVSKLASDEDVAQLQSKKSFVRVVNEPLTDSDVEETKAKMVGSTLRQQSDCIVPAKACVLTLKCKSCSYVAQTPSDLQNHRCTEFSGFGGTQVDADLHLAVKPVITCFCRNQFKNEHSFKAHFEKHKNQLRRRCSYCSFFQCVLCPGTSPELRSMQQHLSIMHNPLKPLKCEDCDQQLPDRHQYKMHKLSHNLLKLFKCTECSFTSVLKAHFDAHKHVHLSNVPFKCVHCFMKIP